MKNVVYKFLILIILFLGLGILGKSNSSYRRKIYYYFYEDNFAFSSFRNFYNEYLGDVFPLSFDGRDVVSVFSEEISYSVINKYLDGYALKVDFNYLVPAIDDGIVTYIGKKDDYGNVIIVSGNDGINIWYGNIQNNSLKLYDSVCAGDFIGEVSDDVLYLVFNKENTFLSYEDFLQ